MKVITLNWIEAHQVRIKWLVKCFYAAWEYFCVNSYGNFMLAKCYHYHFVSRVGKAPWKSAWMKNNEGNRGQNFIEYFAILKFLRLTFSFCSIKIMRYSQVFFFSFRNGNSWYIYGWLGYTKGVSYYPPPPPVLRFKKEDCVTKRRSVDIIRFFCVRSFGVR